MIEVAQLRVGIPKPGGGIFDHAKAMKYPILLSANSLVQDAPTAEVIRQWSSTKPRPRMSRSQAAAWSRSRPPRDFRGWRRNLKNLEGADVALDSAGFVAWAKYGDFRWTVDSYVELAASHDWTWWAQMDACVEDEVAGSPDIVRLRQAETVRLYGECRSRADQVGIDPPMVVLQGRTPADYIWHAREVLDGSELLIGVGSMCRRNLRGEDGLAAVVAALDAYLPAWTTLHLFGVKAEGIAALGAHNRVAWVDSMAWDDGARRCANGIQGRARGNPNPRCSYSAKAIDPLFSNFNPHRIEHMDRWVDLVALARHGAHGEDLSPRMVDPRETGAHLEPWFSLVMDGEIELQGAMCHFGRSGQDIS